jgi:hypothetical protein
MAIVVNPLNRMGWTRDQAAAPPYLSMISGQTLRACPDEYRYLLFWIMR